MEYDIVEQEYDCPVCDSKLLEKIPKDKHVFRKNTVRLYCPCGYYRDEIVSEKDFKNIDEN